MGNSAESESIIFLTVSLSKMGCLDNLVLVLNMRHCQDTQVEMKKLKDISYCYAHVV